MYNFVRGPLLWVALLIFFFGCLYRIISLLKMADKEKCIYPYMNLKYSLRSLLHWSIPFGSRNMRLNPIFTIISFTFHICLLITPVFLLAHNLLLEESWGIRLWTLPETVADIMSVVVILCCIYFLIRRFVSPVVNYVSSPSDIIFVLLVLAPFLTGFVAYHQLFAYKQILIFHILFGEIMLIAIPFSRLSHMLYFVFTRAYMGCEFGEVRNSRDW